ncbi:hypothetical protein DL96DRAFT_364802 [Flagelloscypha sp. PMI_526]|nr:hypothetical protein DL96DRAFT_364802 [Flagelloscypha sp. PMI_526]
MVAIASILICFANVIALISALPAPYYGSVTVKVGEKINGGTGGTIFKVDCVADTACQALGPIALRTYVNNEQGAKEQKALAKIGELKAVSTGEGNKLSLMKGFSGEPLVNTAGYKALTSDVEDKTKLDIAKCKAFVEAAKTLIEPKVRGYLVEHNTLHLDPSPANVLFTEAGGKITGVELLDWYKAEFVGDSEVEIDRAKDAIHREMSSFDVLVSKPTVERDNALKEAKAKQKQSSPAQALGSSKPTVPGSAKPAAPGPAKPNVPSPGSTKPVAS